MMHGILVVTWPPPGARLDGPAINLVFDAGTVPSGTNVVVPDDELEDHMGQPRGSSRTATAVRGHPHACRSEGPDVTATRTTGITKLMPSGDDC